MNNRRRASLRRSGEDGKTKTLIHSGENGNVGSINEYVPPNTVGIIETHISRIFLTPKFVYKQKKPVDYGFVDYTSLEKRIFYARKELSLNRRACSGVYLDLQELRQKKDKFFIGFKGGVLKDVFVRMNLVNSKNFLSNIVKNEGLTADKIGGILKKVAKRIYLFHKSAVTSKRISGFGGIEVYKENWDDNFRALEGFVKAGVFIRKLDGIKSVCNGFLQSKMFGEFIKSRMENGFIRDVHGDLRAEHVAVIDAGRVNGICLMDCVEFDERYRNQDLYLDIAFLLMDFENNGFFYESSVFLDYYKKCFDYKKNIAGYEAYEPTVIPFFKAYRAVVRTKTALLSDKLSDASKYFNLAGFYCELLKKPTVILNCGLSGSGKSSLSSLLSRYFYAQVLSSDEMRCDIYGFTDNIFKYSRHASELVYRSMIEEGLKRFESGKNIIFDATFLKRAHREKIIKSFEKKDCIFIFVYSKIYDGKEKIILSRLASRFEPDNATAEKDYSEADSHIYFNQKRILEEPSDSECEIYGAKSGAAESVSETIDRPLLITVDASLELRERFNAVMKGIIEAYNK